MTLLNAKKQQNKRKERPPKPPPVFIPCVNNITKMFTNLKSVVKSDKYSYKSLRDGRVKLIIKNFLLLKIIHIEKL